MNGKTSAVIRIICWSIIAVALIAVLILGLNKRWHFTPFQTGGWSYPESSKYTAGPAKLPADKIKNINVDWLDGSVTLTTADTDKLTVNETSRQKLSADKQLHYYLKDDTLLIQYRGATKNLISTFSNGLSKKLEIQIPKKYAASFREIVVDGVSSDLSLENLKAEKLYLDSVSGDITLKNIKTDTLTADTTSGSLDSTALIVTTSAVTNTTSGSVSLEGTINDIQHDSVSGDLRVLSDICPQKIQADTTSGSILINIPDNPGFTLDYDTVSGDIHTDFPTTGSDSHLTYESGQNHFRIETTSGDITVRKNQ